MPLLPSVDSANAADPLPGSMAFDGATVRNIARRLAAQPYKAPALDLPEAFKTLDFDAYRDIRFNPDKALWSCQDRKFTVQFFHRGYIYQSRVNIFEVTDGHAVPIKYTPDLFNFGKNQPSTTEMGFAGFRIQYPLNCLDYPDEVCTFLGASYFRAVAKGGGYGLSARGLAIKTADTGGEEFPMFRSFWLERPTSGSDLMVIHALLDSPSTAASFRFTIRPGARQSSILKLPSTPGPKSPRPD